MYGKEQCRERKAEKGYLQKLMSIICIKGSCYETPLYDHVLGDKQDSDKDKVRERGGAQGWGGEEEGRREGLRE
jgi:hypothetical protein